MAGRRRLTALGGVAGPVGFVTAWALGGVVANHYSPVDDAISRLAAVGAPTAPLMNAGFVAFGVGVPLYGLALRERLAGPAWASVVATGLATLGVAAFPLDRSSATDLVHGAFASAGYATLAAAPLLAVTPLRRKGNRPTAVASLAVGTISGACLLATLVGSRHGLFQRTGLTVADAWLVAGALALFRHPVAAPVSHR